MKKILLMIILIISPMAVYAKYCPSCLSTFQVNTTHGQSVLLYDWLMDTLSLKRPLEQKDINHLFSKNVVIVNNGQRLANNRLDVYRWLQLQRKNKPVIQSKLQQLLIDQHFSVLYFETLSVKQKVKYHTIQIAILEFKAHKLYEWRSTSYTSKLG